MAEPFQHILVEAKAGYAVVRLNRPKVLNALNGALIGELVIALEALDADPTCRCAVITGNERAFAAGADIGEMAEAEAIPFLLNAQFAKWDRFRAIHMPLIAAVSGFALGGGCELAMNCDLIIASETAQFGQPEINLGIMPGAGGTQRLTHAVGKVRAMEMILTGAPITAQEALRAGLINRVVPVELYLREAEAMAARIAAQAPVAVRLAKESVLKALDASIADGVDFERKNFFLLFAGEDQKEGMRAFLDKRQPHFEGR
ncbi:MAG TPA: enoyl-CoA hydratase-related protein [Chloroflexota bacterium]|nr:enoyl-CoA hydratase-related protein [Chloroflexota bacterium]